MSQAEISETTVPATIVQCLKLPSSRPVTGLVEDVENGLLQPPRSLPPKYFYDARGSELFEQITETPEYYPTRTEDRLLADHAHDIISLIRPDEILELGSGSSRKTRRLFDACATLEHRCSYAPLDVCEPALVQAAADLAADYPWLQINPIVGDYHAGLEHLPQFNGTRLFVFLGSTIGNFNPAEAHRFMAEVSSILKPGDWLLLGADRVKNSQVLHDAYNDATGVTATFNLNLLQVLNRELKADFNPDYFTHRATYNAARQRIEMRLISKRNQIIHLGNLGHTIELSAGENILTELSHKFTTDDLMQLVAGSGLEVRRHYQPTNGYFSLILAEKQD